jgi:hypothetical protein
VVQIQRYNNILKINFIVAFSIKIVQYCILITLKGFSSSLNSHNPASNILLPPSFLSYYFLALPRFLHVLSPCHQTPFAADVAADLLTLTAETGTTGSNYHYYF